MELGQRILQARQAAGLSQRQLCGDVITRNMLSQIEHGTARPSMDTLQYLAERLGKSIGYFLEEASLESPNFSCIQQARAAFERGNYALVVSQLQEYHTPDAVFDPEYHLMQAISLQELARQSIDEEKRPYALTLLERAQAEGAQTPLYTEALERQRLMLMLRAGASAKPILSRLRDDELLLHKATDALSDGLYFRAATLLNAADDHNTPRWNLLRGTVCLKMDEYRSAAEYLHQAEEEFPKDTAPLLERCYRELEDFKKAYFYACKQR